MEIVSRKAQVALDEIEEISGEPDGGERLPFEEVAGEDGAGGGERGAPAAGGAQGRRGEEAEADIRIIGGGGEQILEGGAGAVGGGAGGGAHLPQGKPSLRQGESALGGSPGGIEEAGEGFIFQKGQTHPVGLPRLENDLAAQTPEAALQGREGEGLRVGLMEAGGKIGMGVIQEIEKKGIGVIAPRRGDRRLVLRLKMSGDGVEHGPHPQPLSFAGEGRRTSPHDPLSETETRS